MPTKLRRRENPKREYTYAPILADLQKLQCFIQKLRPVTFVLLDGVTKKHFDYFRELGTYAKFLAETFHADSAIAQFEKQLPDNDARKKFYRTLYSHTCDHREDCETLGTAFTRWAKDLRIANGDIAYFDETTADYIIEVNDNFFDRTSEMLKTLHPLIQLELEVAMQWN